MADNEEAPVSAFWRVFGDVNVVGCWFHYAQAVIKRVQKLGLRDDYAWMTPMCKTQYAVYWVCRCCQLVRSARHLRTSLLQWSTTTSGAARWMICFAMSGDSGCRSSLVIRNDCVRVTAGAERTTSCAVSYWHFSVFSPWIIGRFVISILLLFPCSCLSFKFYFPRELPVCCVMLHLSCIFMSCIFTQPLYRTSWRVEETKSKI